MMEPNSVRILEELFNKYSLQRASDDKILDLGCGTGLTSLVIAKETGARVFANDLWVRAKELLTEWLGDDSYMFKSPELWKQLIGDKRYFESIIKPYTCFVGIYIKLGQAVCNSGTIKKEDKGMSLK